MRNAFRMPLSKVVKGRFMVMHKDAHVKPQEIYLLKLGKGLTRHGDVQHFQRCAKVSDIAPITILAHACRICIDYGCQEEALDDGGYFQLASRTALLAEFVDCSRRRVNSPSSKGADQLSNGYSSASVLYAKSMKHLYY